MNRLNIFIVFWILVGNGNLAAQDVLFHLVNPSFEGYPRDAVTPYGWESCGYDSTPDILPGPWGVYQRPTNGNTFLGLITRDDDTWEAISQKLEAPLKQDFCYKFQVDLACSRSYAGYAEKPTRFRVWAGDAACQRRQLLVESPNIDHHEWKTYEFKIFPNQDYDYIIIECHYKEPSLLPYRGNLLIDNITAFESCDRA